MQNDYSLAKEESNAKRFKGEFLARTVENPRGHGALLSYDCRF
jgi:hypothetical protein